MKRILIFSVAYEPFIGGAEIAVREITSRIPDIQFDVITLNLDGKQEPEEIINNIHIYRIEKGSRISKLLFPFTACNLAVTLHRKEKYDAIWSIMASFSGFAALFFKYRNKNVPFILTLQEGDPISYIKRQVWFIYPLFKQIFKKADKVQTISTYLAKFAKDMGARVEPIVIPNGVDLETFSVENPIENRDLSTVTLITVSRLVVKNAVRDIISSLALLPTNTRLIILGKGPLEEELKTLVTALDLTSRVIFQGEVLYKDIPLYLQKADIFIRPSLSEGMGNVFIEAMAAGVPVIATPVGGIPDFLKDGETGLFCEVENPQSIANTVERLISDTELKEKIIHNSLELVREKYDWSTIAHNMETQVFG